LVQLIIILYHQYQSFLLIDIIKLFGSATVNILIF